MVHQTGIHVCCISFGYIDTPKVAEKFPNNYRIPVEKAAYYIKWVLEQPNDIIITDLNIDPIQKNGILTQTKVKRA